MSKELKIGDRIEVKVGVNMTSWEPATFIKYGEAGSVICVYGAHEENYSKGRSFAAFLQEAGSWRIPEEKTYRPFTWEERDQLRGKWVKKKNKEDKEDIEGMIDGLSMDFDRFLIYFSVYFVTNNELLDWYTFLDGSPCGVLVDQYKEKE